jgi:hypothetical protein
MRTWLRSIVNAILGRVAGKTSRPDAATRMAMDADSSDRSEPTPAVLRRWHERDDQHLAKSADRLAEVDLLQELICIVNEAQERDAEDERQLDHMFA